MLMIRGDKMKIANIRTTVIRSNPQMIRKIHIARQSSLETLAKVVSICYGLSPESCGLSDGDGGIFSGR